MSGFIQVSSKTKIKETGEVFEDTIEYDFGENLEEMKSLFGEEVVFTQARSQMKVGCQAAMRRHRTAGKDPAEIPNLWKPGVQMERIADPIASALAKFGTMNAEEKAEFLSKLEAIG